MWLKSSFKKVNQVFKKLGGGREKQGRLCGRSGQAGGRKMVVPSRRGGAVTHKKDRKQERSRRSNAKHAPYLFRSPSSAAQRGAVARTDRRSTAVPT